MSFSPAQPDFERDPMLDQLFADQQNKKSTTTTTGGPTTKTGKTIPTTATDITNTSITNTSITNTSITNTSITTTGDTTTTGITTNTPGTNNTTTGTTTTGTTKPTTGTTKHGRVSITFDVGPGCLSRDFPGRPYDSSERNILQSWSKEFRQVI